MAVEERVTRLEERLSSVREDVRELHAVNGDNRKRIHELESQAQAVKALAETIQQMPQQMRGLAREAASQALIEQRREHHGILNMRTQIAAGLLGFVVTVCTIVTTIVTVTGGGH